MSIEHEPAPTYTTREPVVADVPEIRAVHAASWIAAYPNEAEGVSYEWVKERTDSWLLPETLARSAGYLEAIFTDQQQFYRLGTKDEKIVGFIHGSTKEDGSKYLEALYTSPETFGTGLGNQLFDEFDTWIGNEAASLEVTAYNDRAIRFYEKRGFKKLDGSEAMFADIMPTFIMVREANSKVTTE